MKRGGRDSPGACARTCGAGRPSDLTVPPRQLNFRRFGESPAMARLPQWLLACVFTGLATPALAATEPLPIGDSGAYVRHLAELINDYRAHSGLGPLELAADLSALASEHAMQMVAHRRLSHDGFRDRFDRTQARICVEERRTELPARRGPARRVARVSGSSPEPAGAQVGSHGHRTAPSVRRVLRLQLNSSAARPAHAARAVCCRALIDAAPRSAGFDTSISASSAVVTARSSRFEGRAALTRTNR